MEPSPAVEDGEDGFSLDASFFVDRSYELTTFTFGSQELKLLCLRSASTDYDLTGQLVWPGAVLMNNYLSEHPEVLKGKSVIELGSGVGVTGILCSRYCREVVLTDHNDEVLEILKKNIELQLSTGASGLTAEKLEWGNSNHLNMIVEKFSSGFDLVLGADICYQQASMPHLFATVEKLLHIRNSCSFVLAYISRAKIMDRIIFHEADNHGMIIKEINGTRTSISNYEGVILEMSLRP